MFESGSWFRTRLVAVPLVLTVFAFPVAAYGSCFDECHEVAMTIYDGDTDVDNPDWQFANSWFQMCMGRSECG